MLRSAEHDEILRLLEQETAPQAARKIRTWADIPDLASLPDLPVTWLVPGMIPRQGVILLAGESGSYKTWLALLLAKAVAAAGSFLGRACAGGAVLYLDRENPCAVVRERRELLGIDSRGSFKIWGVWEEDAPPGIGDARLLEIAREQKPLIIFDSLIRFHSADENSASEMARVMADLRALATAGAAVVVLHHKAKSESSRYRGSSDIHAGVDVAFTLSHDRDAGFVRMDCFKNRLAEEFSLTLRPEIEERGDFGVTEPPALVRAREEVAHIAAIIRSEPGLSQIELIRRSGLRKGRLAAILRREAGRLWRIEPGVRNALNYYPPELGAEGIEITPYGG
jgi:predicted ATP-dependent serine protease